VQPAESRDGDTVTLLQNCNALNPSNSSSSNKSISNNSSAALHRAHATCLAQLLILQKLQVEVDSPSPNPSNSSKMTSLAAAVATISSCAHASADMLIVTACAELALQYCNGGQLSQAHKLFT
jgi:hypothetical protein